MFFGGLALVLLFLGNICFWLIWGKKVLSEKEACFKVKKQLEKQIQEKAHELEKTNEELHGVNKELLMEHLTLEKNVRELKSAQAQLIQVGKMTALGTMGAGIAHQLNQPLTGIMIPSQLLLSKITPDNPHYAHLKMIEEQALYMKDVIDHLSGFARQANLKKQEIDINHHLNKSLDLAAEQLRLSEITVIRKWEETLPKVEAAPNLMEQVFINFITNARESMENLPSGEKRELSIQTQTAKDTPNIEIHFTDVGEGIESEVKQRIFEPFFSTKGAKGTGLGLSLNYGIVEEHGGDIRVRSEVGKGTTFTIVLPYHEGERSYDDEETTA